MGVTKVNLDDATIAEVQKYIEDQGIVDLRLRRSPSLHGWVYVAKLVNETTFIGGPLPEMSDCFKALIIKLEGI